MARVLLVVGPRGGRFPSSNCLLVRGARATVLVDAGCGEERVADLRGRVDAVVYTHLHPDHFPHYKLLEGIPAYAPEADAAYETLEALAARYAPEAVGEWLSYVRRVFGLQGVPRGLKPVPAWGEVRVGDVSLTLIPARGHTRGHSIILTGTHAHLADVDLTSFGPWYGHPESSIEAFTADIKAALELEAKTYTTSHKPETYNPTQLHHAAQAYLQALCRQLDSVAQAAHKTQAPVKPQQLAGQGVIYKKYLPGLEAIMKYFETVMIEKILDTLTANGDATKTPQGYKPKPQAPTRTCTKITQQQ